jgi:hypothetical protein
VNKYFCSVCENTFDDIGAANNCCLDKLSINIVDCPTCTLIATGGMFIDGICLLHDKRE